jgi:hypothetical protein
VTVSCDITDESKAVVSATLYFRNDDGDSIGAFTPITMTNTGGSNYEATIPAPHPDPYLNFYVEATDDATAKANVVTNPGNAPDAFYELAVGYTSIYAMQYRDPSQALQGNNYFDLTLNIKGIVTAGTGQAGAPSRFILQEAERYDPDTHGPGVGIEGSYQWGAVLVYEGTAANFTARGDEVAIGGHGDEYFGLTEMAPHNPSAVYVLSFNNDLPMPMYERTRALADNTLDDGDDIRGEAYESVWVRTRASCVLDTLGFGEYIISDTCIRADTCEVDPEVTLSYSPIINDVVIVEGFIDYDFGDFQITPIADEFIVSGLTAIDNSEQPMVVLPAGGFVGISPNPFNPKTEISFKVNRPNLTQLNIYDIRGQLVRTLVNDRLPAMEHVVIWDGTDSTGQVVSSGTYFARLRIGLEVMQVQKLTMLK